ncbi:MAG: phage major capsid protein [Firmicutes bacterium]|nr:phage major capsid protein [Bacillota bacterium]
MSLKSELVELKDRLSALKERIEADDQEAINEGVQLKADIESKTAEIEEAEKKAAVLEVLGTIEEKEEEKMEENGIKALDLEYLKSNRGSVSTYVKAATDAVVKPTIPVIDQNVAEINYILGVRDLFNAEEISGNSLTFFRMGATDLPDAFDGKTAEGAEKPQIHPTYAAVTVALQKIAAHLKESDELLNDAPFLESVVRGRGAYEVRKAIEKYLVSTLLATSGIDVSVNDGISFDNLLKAKMAVMENVGYEADAIIINPADLQTLLIQKDGGQSGQYLMGGPAYAPYGNGQYGAYLPIWGMKVVPSNAIAQGTAIVGAFKACASVVSKAGEGFRVEVANQNEDDFVKNMLTVRIEERLLEAVRLPGGFAKVYTASTTTTG